MYDAAIQGCSQGNAPALETKNSELHMAANDVVFHGVSVPSCVAPLVCAGVQVHRCVVCAGVYGAQCHLLYIYKIHIDYKNIL